MAEVKFGNSNGAAPAPAIDVPPTTPAVVEQPPQSQVPATTGGGFRLGDRLPGFKDVILPRLNLVQAMGQLKESFPVGALVFDKSTVIYTPPVIDAKQGVITKPAMAPVTIYVIGIVSEKFAEKVKGGVGGIVVDTEAEVRANGGTLDFKEFKSKEAEGMRRFEPLVELLVAIEKPAELNDEGSVFGFDVDDRKVAIGFWACRGVSYTHAVKKVFNYHRLAGVLKGGYYTHPFYLTTRYETWQGGLAAWVPVAVPAKQKSTPAFIEFVRNIVGA